ncbi:MAG TPA: hypothetical protein VIG99_32965 [Myxococcaceae bacterium]
MTRPQDAAHLQEEIAELTRQLDALPLAKSNRDTRLKLNDLKRTKESELAEVFRAEKLEQLRTRLQEIDVELGALEKGPATRDRRQALLNEQREAKKDLELSERGTAP